MLGSAHLAVAVLAMTAGGVVVALRKGTRWHRRFGLLYVAAMLALNATALSIYGLFGRFAPSTGPRSSASAR